jgi:hypothetical protein
MGCILIGPGAGSWSRRDLAYPGVSDHFQLFPEAVSPGASYILAAISHFSGVQWRIQLNADRSWHSKRKLSGLPDGPAVFMN